MKKLQKTWIVVLAGMGLLFWNCAGEPAPPANTTPETGIPAIDALSQQIAQTPNNAELYYLRSKAYYDNDMLAQAVPDAEKAVALDSTKAEYYRQLGNAYFDNNQSKPALKALEKALERFPQEHYFYLMMAEMSLIVQQYNDALISVDKLLKIEPYNAEGLFMRGQVLKYMGDTLQAMIYYQKTVEQDADHINGYLQLGILSCRMGQAIGLQYLDNALRIDSTSLTALMNKAWYYHNTNQFDQAVIWYEKAIVQHPQDPEPPYNLGILYLEKAESKSKSANADYEQAAKYFDTATKLEPTFGEAYYYRGLCKEQLGDKTGAFADYDQALVFEQLIQGVPISTIRDAMLRVKKG